MYKLIVLISMLTATALPKDTHATRHEAVVSMTPSKAFLKACETRQIRQRKKAPHLIPFIEEPRGSLPQDITPSPLVMCGTILAGSLLGTGTAHFFPRFTEKARIPLLLVLTYFLLGGQLPTGNLFEGIGKLYKLLKFLEKTPAERRVDVLITVFENPEVLGEMYESSLLGRFCAEAHALLFESNVPRKALAASLQSLIEEHKKELANKTYLVVLLTNLLFTTSGAALISSFKQEEREPNHA